MNDAEWTALAQRQLEARASAVGGKAWGLAKGKPRIYLPLARKDAKVFIAFADFPTGNPDDVLGGPSLCVTIDECGQHPNWYKSQRAKLLAEYVGVVDTLAAMSYPAQAEPLHGQPVTRDQAESLTIGETVTFYYGGAAGDANPERSYTGTVENVTTRPDAPQTIAPDSDGQTVAVQVVDGPTFYTWRGLLRYGGGAEVVRR